MIDFLSPSTTLEWGLCILTLGFCWWRYRGTSASNVVRMFLKKLEVFIIPSRTNRVESINLREEKYLNGIPTEKSDLNPRRYGRKPENLRKPVKDLNFYRTLNGLTTGKSETNNNKPICSICSHPEKEAQQTVRTPSTDLKNCLDCETREPWNPWYVRLCAFFVFFWRKWYIGYQYSMVSLKDMINDVKVNQAVEDAAKYELPANASPGTFEKLVQKHRQRMHKLVSEMRAKQPASPWFSYFVRVASWIIGKTLGRIYPQILVRRSQIEVIRKARESGNPIVYLPVHRSHVDYVLVSWVLVACDMRAPLVAAGENLNIPIFSLMMKSVGGFFIKRRLDCREGKRDILYRAILHSYMTRSLTDDNDLEFFIEGGRTRTGKPCLPKGGLLSIVVDALLTNKVEDLLIVPVNFSYERLLDGNFIREQLGRPKVSESFASAALALWNSLQAKFGSARIDFGQPFSLREFVHAYQLGKVSAQIPFPIRGKEASKLNGDGSSRSSLCLTGVDSVDQREMVNNLARHVLYDGQKCFSLMSTNAIAFILLNKYRQGLSTQLLSKEIEQLMKEMLERGFDVGISGDIGQVITHGLTVLGPALVRQEVKPSANGSSTVVRPVTMLPNVIELAYYSNCVLPAYALEAVVATTVSVLSGAKRTEAESISIDENVLIAACLEFCEILQNEFIFTPPCTDLEYAVRNTIQYMITQKVFFKPNADMIHVDTKNHLERITFLASLLKPIMDTYFTAACVLRRLIGCEVKEKQFHMDILAEVKSLLQCDLLPFGESLALDPVRNFIKLLSGWDVLESYTYDRVTVYYLQDHFDNQKNIEEVVRRIQKFRV